MELWDVLNERGEKTGKTIVRGERLHFGQFHQVVHIWIINSAGLVLIQKRAPHVQKMPGVWAVTGGSAVTGEDSLTAARRELLEEMGIDVPPDALQFFARIRRSSSFGDLWLLRQDIAREELVLQSEEVSDARWVTWEQLDSMVRSHEFHNYGRSYFHTVYRFAFGSKKSGAKKGKA